MAIAAKKPASKVDLASLTPAQARAIQRLARPDFWAADLRLTVDGHDFTLKGREYEIAILRDEHEWIVIPKGAQLGLTTIFIIRTCHWITQRRWNHMTLLPLKTGSVTFVQARIDPIIDSNPQLKTLFSRTDNRNHKQTTEGVNWYIRGTNIQTELREVPVDVLVVDERDVAHEENLIEHAYERLAGSTVRRRVELSTPTVEGHGVYSEDGWAASDQMQWWVACPHCASKQVFSFEENLEPWIGNNAFESELHCSYCKRQITDTERADINATGQWVPANPNGLKRGYHISQFNSPTKAITDMAVNWFKGQRDAKAMAAFMRNQLGLPYTAAGDKFTPQVLDKAIIPGHQLRGMPNGPVFLGIDVQYDSLYLTAFVTNRLGQRLLWDAKIITGRSGKSKWQVLEDEYFNSLFSWKALIDAHPAKEEVEHLSKRYSGRVVMAFEKDMPSQPETANWHSYKRGEVAKVTIDRTMGLDSYIKAFLDGNIGLSMDARELGEHMSKLAYNSYYHQHLQMTRVEQPDANGNLIARWVNGYTDDIKRKTTSPGNRPDHFHHSGMFAWIASMGSVPLHVAPEVGAMFQAAGNMVGA